MSARATRSIQRPAKPQPPTQSLSAPAGAQGRCRHIGGAGVSGRSAGNITGLEKLAALLGPVIEVPPLCPTCGERLGEGGLDDCDTCREERIARNQPDAKTKAALARGNQDI